MRERFIGETIRRKRLEQGATQEKLCEGLCDPATLSRIENGKQAPSRSLANALLQRLSQPYGRYYALLAESEAETGSLRASIDSYVSCFQKSLGEEKRLARLGALEQLDRLSSAAETDGNITRQYVLAMRVLLGTEDGPYGPEVRLDMLLEAIRLTVPRFNIDALDGQLYSIDEAGIIGQIAGTYSEAGQHETAAGIFYQLLTYMQEHGQDVTHPSRYLSPAALNYARELCLLGRYEEALETAEMGQRNCLDYGYCQPLPGLLAVMAECRYAAGEFERSGTLYRQAYYLYKETGNASGLAAVEETARKRLGSEFPLQGVLA